MRYSGIHLSKLRGLAETRPLPNRVDRPTSLLDATTASLEAHSR
jgi:hypothetical protein